MAPLIDCVFLLLIFFMLSSSFLQPAIPLQLPESSAREMPEPHRIVISSDAEGSLFVNDQPVELGSLGAHLRGLADPASEPTVLFRGDQDIRYERFIEVVEAARAAGFHHLSLQHQAAAPEP